MVHMQRARNECNLDVQAPSKLDQFDNLSDSEADLADTGEAKIDAQVRCTTAHRFGCGTCSLVDVVVFLSRYCSAVVHFKLGLRSLCQ